MAIASAPSSISEVVFRTGSWQRATAPPNGILMDEKALFTRFWTDESTTTRKGLAIVHHRGQISTYLRPMGSTVPQIYGRSGDEP